MGRSQSAHSARRPSGSGAAGTLPLMQPAWSPEELLTLHGWVLGALCYAQTAHLALAAAGQHARRSAAQPVSLGSTDSNAATFLGRQRSQSPFQWRVKDVRCLDAETTAALAHAASTQEKLQGTLAAVRVGVPFLTHLHFLLSLHDQMRLPALLVACAGGNGDSAVTGQCGAE